MNSLANQNPESVNRPNPNLLIEECRGAGLIPLLPFEARELSHSQEVTPVTKEAVGSFDDKSSVLHERLRKLASHAINGDRLGIVMPYPDRNESTITLGSIVTCQTSSLQRPGLISQYLLTGYLKALPDRVAETFPDPDNIDAASLSSPIGHALLHNVTNGRTSYIAGRREFNLKILRVTQFNDGTGMSAR